MVLSCFLSSLCLVCGQEARPKLLPFSSSHLPGRWKAAVLALHALLQASAAEDQRAMQAPEQLFPGQPAGEGAVQPAQQRQPLQQVTCTGRGHRGCLAAPCSSAALPKGTGRGAGGSGPWGWVLALPVVLAKSGFSNPAVLE